MIFFMQPYRFKIKILLKNINKTSIINKYLFYIIIINLLVPYGLSKYNLLIPVFKMLLRI